MNKVSSSSLVCVKGSNAFGVYDGAEMWERSADVVLKHLIKTSRVQTKASGASDESSFRCKAVGAESNNPRLFNHLVLKAQKFSFL